LPRILFDGVLIACFGAIAQLEERLHGMQEVVGSIPSGSTNLRDFKCEAKISALVPITHSAPMGIVM
jgi:hypothetical protein